MQSSCVTNYCDPKSIVAPIISSLIVTTDIGDIGLYFFISIRTLSMLVADYLLINFLKIFGG